MEITGRKQLRETRKKDSRIVQRVENMSFKPQHKTCLRCDNFTGLNWNYSNNGTFVKFHVGVNYISGRLLFLEMLHAFLGLFVRCSKV